MALFRASQRVRVYRKWPVDAYYEDLTGVVGIISEVDDVGGQQTNYTVAGHYVHEQEIEPLCPKCGSVQVTHSYAGLLWCRECAAVMYASDWIFGMKAERPEPTYPLWGFLQGDQATGVPRSRRSFNHRRGFLND